MPNYENVPVSIRLSPDGKFYEVGTEINGEFRRFTWAEFPASNFDYDVRAAQAIQDENARQAAAQQLADQQAAAQQQQQQQQTPPDGSPPPDGTQQ